MIEERVYVQRHAGAQILAALFVSLLVVILAFWLVGVLTVKHLEGGPVVITVDFSKVEQASHEAVEKTGEALERAGQDLRENAGAAPAAEPAAPPQASPPVSTKTL
jgi:hypothetical protein